MLYVREKRVLKGRELMNKIAMITGAGSGVGRAVAKALAPQGWSLVLVGRKQETLEETAHGLAGDHLVAPADVGDPAQVKAVFARLKDKFGRLDMLFNNAGMGTPAIPDRGTHLRAVAGGGRASTSPAPSSAPRRPCA